jgi:hypothetical protein
MTATNHALTGTLIASLISNPGLAIIMAFASHFLLDALPHFGFKDNTDRYKGQLFKGVLIVDMVFFIIFLSLLLILELKISLVILLLCIFAAISPDITNIPRFLRELKTKKEIKTNNFFIKFHTRIQKFERPWGIGVEVLVAIVLFSLLYLRLL